jgi:hypothetical protein
MVHAPCDLCGEERGTEIEEGVWSVESFPWNKTGIWMYLIGEGYYDDGSNAFLCSEECWTKYDEENR